MILHLDLKDNGYDIIIEHGCLNKAGEYLNLNRNVLIVSDTGVPFEYVETLLKQCPKGHYLLIEQGEVNKNLDNYAKILKELCDLRFNRKDCVIALGGGVVGDISGFAASCYMRGIDFYNIPTTSLSEIDSSIGGKTAIDFGGLKNIVGTFYQPKKVLIDPDTLKTLSERHLYNGLVEGLKMAACFDEDTFDIFMNEDIISHLDEIICKSLLIKKDVVEKDEKESGLRKVLNFGHTVGHGIEVSTDDILHGESVALGMLVMASKEVREKLLSIYPKMNIRTDYDIDVKKVMEALRHDKKGNDDGVDCVVVNRIGSFEIVKMTYEEIEERLTDCKEVMGR
ncbi:MAG: 3-dehydroquinate synthase family protein [Erysipelotrichaceae bacterium]|nr:3-dehydroquinate synthase family protein [Erysipelotrichaceae bacterium]